MVALEGVWRDNVGVYDVDSAEKMLYNANDALPLMKMSRSAPTT